MGTFLIYVNKIVSNHCRMLSVSYANVDLSILFSWFVIKLLVLSKN